MAVATVQLPGLAQVRSAAATIRKVAAVTPLQVSRRYSADFDARIMMKREDLQEVRSYKIRGAFNKMSSLSEEERKNGVVCASAGNHSQGVALSCKELQVKGTIFMPVPTPKQKITQVRMFGEDQVEIILKGDTFDDAYKAAVAYGAEHNKTFVHPFDDEKVIEGQATVGLEILEQTQHPLDYVFVPIGGGGLVSGLLSVFHQLSPSTRIVGVEPLGAPSMSAALRNDRVTELSAIDKFIDGAAVQRVGYKTFEICKNHLHHITTVAEGKVCAEILELYNRDAIVVEPAGALTLAALSDFKEEIRGKNVVCIVSGSNNDITRMAEIKERALLHTRLKHYFIIRFPQRAGALKEFVVEILGPTDDITYFQYTKKHERENGPAVVGVELKKEEDLMPLTRRMKAHNFYGDYLNDKPDLFQYLV